MFFIQRNEFGHNNSYTIVEFRLFTYDDSMLKRLRPTITSKNKNKIKSIFIALKTHKAIYVFISCYWLSNASIPVYVYCVHT